MNRVLTDGDIDAICHRLSEFSGLSAEEHREHHSALAAFIEVQRRKTEFWDKVQQQVGGWAVIGILSAIGYSAWNGYLWILSKAH